MGFCDADDVHERRTNLLVHYDHAADKYNFPRDICDSSALEFGLKVELNARLRNTHQFG